MAHYYLYTFMVPANWLARAFYLHIDDYIDGILFGLKHSKEWVNTSNLGTDSSTEVTAIADMLVAAMGLSAMKFYRTGYNRGSIGDVPQVRLGMTKMNTLDRKAKYNSDEVVRQTIRDVL